jgi:hypothetical protein
MYDPAMPVVRITAATTADDVKRHMIELTLLVLEPRRYMLCRYPVHASGRRRQAPSPHDAGEQSVRGVSARGRPIRAACPTNLSGDSGQGRRPVSRSHNAHTRRFRTTILHILVMRNSRATDKFDAQISDLQQRHRAEIHKLPLHVRLESHVIYESPSALHPLPNRCGRRQPIAHRFALYPVCKPL